MQVGTLLHSLFAQAAKAFLAGEPAMSLDNARERLELGWAGLGWRSPATAAAAMEQTVASFARYRKWADGRRERQLSAAETPFRIELVLDSLPVAVRGRVDRLETDEEGRSVVVDFKTGKGGKPDAYLDQLGCYELAVAAGAFGEGLSTVAGPSELVWPTLDPRKTNPGDVGCKVTPAPPIALGVSEFDTYASEFHSRLAHAAQIVRSGAFDAIAGVGCQRCAFRSGCPAVAGDWGDERE
jgi:hypothetical protein